VKLHTADKFIEKGGILSEELWDNLATWLSGEADHRSCSLLIEGETAFSNFHQGKEEIDYQQFSDLISVLQEVACTILWYPIQILPNSKTAPNRLASTTKLVRTIAEAVPNSKFVAGYSPGDDLQLNAGLIRSVGRDRILPCMEVNVPAGKYYAPKDVSFEMGKRATEKMLVHITHSKWLELAEHPDWKGQQE